MKLKKESNAIAENNSNNKKNSKKKISSVANENVESLNENIMLLNINDNNTSSITDSTNKNNNKNNSNNTDTKKDKSITVLFCENITASICREFLKLGHDKVGKSLMKEFVKILSFLNPTMWLRYNQVSFILFFL
jgi:hypothetical protein